MEDQILDALAEGPKTLKELCAALNIFGHRAQMVAAAVEALHYRDQIKQQANRRYYIPE